MKLQPSDWKINLFAKKTHLTEVESAPSDEIAIVTVKVIEKL